MHLSRNELKKLILEQKIVTDYDDLDHQLTANGIDVRAGAIIEVLEGGRLAVNKKDNKPPALGAAYVLKGLEERLKDYSIKDLRVVNEKTLVRLKRLRPYFVMTCERVNVPKNMMVHNATRSSFFRFPQCFVEYGFTEAGYQGFLTFLLLPIAAGGEIELGARILQMSFCELKGEGDYSKQKESSHQGGKLF